VKYYSAISETTIHRHVATRGRFILTLTNLALLLLFLNDECLGEVQQIPKQSQQTYSINVIYYNYL